MLWGVFSAVFHPIKVFTIGYEGATAQAVLDAVDLKTAPLWPELELS